MESALCDGTHDISLKYVLGLLGGGGAHFDFQHSGGRGR